MFTLTNEKLKKLLEHAYIDYHTMYHREKDPISFVHKYKNHRDQEVAAFISSLISYGNVKIILNNLEKLFNILGPSPHETVKKKTFIGKLDNFTHRFTCGKDLEVILYWLSLILETHNSIEDFFFDGMKISSTTKELIINFIERFAALPLKKELKTIFLKRRKEILYLLPSPLEGSACKRFNLFLRWVTRRKDEIDLGLWTKLPPSKLMLPIDTHIMKTLKLLKITKRQSPSWKVVEDSTAFLRTFDSNDPIRFDFALCHLSMCGENLLNKYTI